jgi:large subunit ribosomal protein L28
MDISFVKMTASFRPACSRCGGILSYPVDAIVSVQRAAGKSSALVRRCLFGAYYSTPQFGDYDEGRPGMSKVCMICGKKPSFGNNRSHSMRATPRRWDPNVQKIRIQLNGRALSAYVCAKCLKAHKVEKAG